MCNIPKQQISDVKERKGFDMKSEDWVYKISRTNGKHIPLFVYLNIPKGWVVTADVPMIFWEKCRLDAYPMKAIDILGLFNNTALHQWKACIELLGTDFMMVMIPDDKSEGGYNAGPILLSNLQKDPPPRVVTRFIKVLNT